MSDKHTLEKIQRVIEKAIKLRNKYDSCLNNMKERMDPEYYWSYLENKTRVYGTGISLKILEEMEKYFKVRENQQLEAIMINPDMENFRNFMRVRGKVEIICEMREENVVFEIFKEEDDWNVQAELTCNVVEEFLNGLDK